MGEQYGTLNRGKEFVRRGCEKGEWGGGKRCKGVLKKPGDIEYQRMKSVEEKGVKREIGLER